MATPNELYARQDFQFAALEVLQGCYYNHIQESGIDDYSLYTVHSPRVEIRVLKNFDFDGRRFWRLATVWFDGQPIMIIQNAGREGDDHYERFITDKPKFLEMCQHIRQIVPSNAPDCTEPDVVDADTDNPKLTSFYSNSLDGYFERY